MEKIIDHLVNKCNQSSEIATIIASPLERRNDIYTELKTWLEQRTYPQENPLTIEGYTAEDISKLAPFMDGVGVYNFMVTLRERPESGRRIIAEGFPRK